MNLPHDFKSPLLGIEIISTNYLHFLHIEKINSINLFVLLLYKLQILSTKFGLLREITSYLNIKNYNSQYFPEYFF